VPGRRRRMSPRRRLVPDGPDRWRIERTGAMRVPGVVYASQALLPAVAEEEVLEQVANVATLPGIVSASYAMPDVHWGYGFPIGGVGEVCQRRSGSLPGSSAPWLESADEGGRSLHIGGSDDAGRLLRLTRGKRACHPITNSLPPPRILHDALMFLASCPQGTPVPRSEPEWRGRPGACSRRVVLVGVDPTGDPRTVSAPTRAVAPGQPR